MRRSVSLPMSMIVPALLAAGCDRASPPAGQGNGAAPTNVASVSPDEVAPAAAPAAATPAGTIDRSHAGATAPDFAFTDPSGKTVSIASFRGKPVLLNLWATWCAPCIGELPTLDRLAAREAGRIVVVTLSQDSDAAKARAFLVGRTLPHLAAYTDPATKWAFGGYGHLPTTILYDAAGKEVWRAEGPRDWTDATSAEALAIPSAPSA